MSDSIDLGNDLETFIETVVRSGRFRSRGEVLQEGVRLVEARETRRAELDEALARGLGDADAERVRPVDSVADRLIAKYEALAKARAD